MVSSALVGASTACLPISRRVVATSEISSRPILSSSCLGRFFVSVFPSHVSQAPPLMYSLLPLSVSVSLLAVPRPASPVVVQALVVPAGAEQAEPTQTDCCCEPPSKAASWRRSLPLFADCRPVPKPPNPAIVFVPIDPKSESRGFCCTMPSPARPESIVFY